jgi:hypothetical protein
VSINEENYGCNVKNFQVSLSSQKAKESLRKFKVRGVVGARNKKNKKKITDVM